MDSSAVATNTGLLLTLTTVKQRKTDGAGKKEEEEGEQKGAAVIELKAAAIPSYNTNISTYSGFNS